MSEHEHEARADVPKQAGEAAQLEGELERLTDAIGRLEQMLSPALGPERPTSTMLDTVGEGTSHLRLLRVRLSGQVDRLGAVMGRVEL